MSCVCTMLEEGGGGLRKASNLFLGETGWNRPLWKGDVDDSVTLNYFLKKESRRMIRGFHSGDYEECRLLGYGAV
jgi:hypothetical protein